jgi:hypothetical protein
MRRYRYSGFASVSEGSPPHLVVDTTCGKPIWFRGREDAEKFVEEHNREPTR